MPDPTPPLRLPPLPEPDGGPTAGRVQLAGCTVPCRSTAGGAWLPSTRLDAADTNGDWLQPIFLPQPPQFPFPPLQRMPHVRQHRLVAGRLAHPWAVRDHPRPSQVAAAAVRRVLTPALAVRQAATPCRCLRPGAGGWRRACGGGKAVRKAAEPGGGQGSACRRSAHPACPTAVLKAAGWAGGAGPALSAPLVCPLAVCCPPPGCPRPFQQQHINASDLFHGHSLLTLNRLLYSVHFARCCLLNMHAPPTL